MSAGVDRMQLDAAPDAEICAVEIPPFGTVRDTAKNLRQFFAKWEEPAREAERLRLGILEQTRSDIVAAALSNDPVVREIAEAANNICYRLEGSPLRGDCSVVRDWNHHRCEAFGAEVLKRLSRGDAGFFKTLAAIAKSKYSFDGAPDHPGTDTIKGRILWDFVGILRGGLDHLPTKDSIRKMAKVGSSYPNQENFENALRSVGLAGLPNR